MAVGETIPATKNLRAVLQKDREQRQSNKHERQQDVRSRRICVGLVPRDCLRDGGQAGQPDRESEVGVTWADHCGGNAGIIKYQT